MLSVKQSVRGAKLLCPTTSKVLHVANRTGMLRVPYTGISMFVTSKSQSVL